MKQQKRILAFLLFLTVGSLSVVQTPETGSAFYAHASGKKNVSNEALLAWQEQSKTEELTQETTSENMQTEVSADAVAVTTKASVTTEAPGKWIVKKGKKYYRKANGRLVKKKFYIVKKKTYYFDQSGEMVTGWMKKKGEYFYMDRTNGVMRTKCTVDGIRLKKDGTAKQSEYAKAKIETMITARSIMRANTKATDSKSKKLKKCFNWVLKHPYKRYRTLRSIRKKKGWETIFANDVYKKGNGCCVSEASAFSFLAHECGYEAYICDDTGHAWTEINGRVYDTLFAEAKSYKKYFNSSYRTARLCRVEKLKI